MKNFFILFFASLTFSCQIASSTLDIEPKSTLRRDIEGDIVSHEMIVLGTKLQDPYSIDNMTKALESLYPTKAERIVLEPTDYYLRFLPKNENEYNTLCEKYEIIDHPVDFKIVKEGDYYHDPSIDENDYTYQYAVVSIKEVLPNDIEYEILDKVYIPEHSSKGTKANDGLDWLAIERQSYLLTGNEDLLSSNTKGQSTEAIPEGQLTIYDASSDTISGLKGVLISCNSFVKFCRTYTDEDGIYQMDKKFSSNPRYRIIYKNKYGPALGFNLVITPATHCALGKGSPSGLSIEINEESDRVLFSRSVVNNALYDYYSMCCEKDTSIKAPPTDLRLWLFQNLEESSAAMMHHGVFMDRGLVKKYLKEYSAILQFFLPDITLGLKGAETYDEIYSRTIHELAHSSHFMSVGVDYWSKLSEFIVKSFVTSGFVVYGSGTEEDSGYCEVAEMWAYYLQNELYSQMYPDSKMVYGTRYWFRPQIFLFLSERGLSKDRIFNALTRDVVDREILQKKLISLNPQFKATINTAFNRYN